MSCGGGCCQRKNYNSDKPLSKRIPQVLLVLFVVWLIGFGYLAQIINQPTRKPKNKKRHNKRNKRNNSGFFGELRNNKLLIFAIVISVILLAFILIVRFIRHHRLKLESHIQNKWEEAIAEQQRRHNERMKNYYGYDDDDDDSDDYNGPRIRELETEEEEAHWRSLMEKERIERERKIAAAAAEISSDDEMKKTR